MANVPLASLSNPYPDELTSASTSSRASSVKAETPKKGSGFKKFFTDWFANKSPSLENLHKKEKEEIEAQKAYWSSSPTQPIQTARTHPQATQSRSYPPDLVSTQSTPSLDLQKKRAYTLDAAQKLASPHLRTTAFDQLSLEQLIVAAPQPLEEILLDKEQFQQTLKGVATFQDAGEFDLAFKVLQQLGQQIEHRSHGVGGSSINNYPGDIPLAQVNCDAYHAEDYGLYAFSLIADGCGWGTKSRQAAQRAIAGATLYIKQVLSQSAPTNAQELAGLLLRSVAVAHETILKDKQDAKEVGTTTLNICFRFTAENEQKYLLTVGVGDAKVFVAAKNQEEEWETKEVASGRLSNQDIRDPGGRLGPYVGPGRIDPDLKNLRIICCLIPYDCFILNMTDGAHDNLQPEQAGLKPQDIDENFLDKKWKDLKPEEKEELEDRYQQNYLTSLVNKAVHSGNTHLNEICTHLTKYCHDLTHPIRSFMQNNPKEREPDDKKEYPGKMDHCTVVAC